MVAASDTRVTVLDDISANPPVRTKVRINEDVDIGDTVAANNIGFDVSLTVYNGIEIYMENLLWGAKYQFLNNGPENNVWVGSAQGAYGTKSESTDDLVVSGASSNAEASSDVVTSQAGISLGYKFNRIVPYFSYIYEAHKIETKVKSIHGNFGPYDDEGVHSYYSLGISSHGPGLRLAFEYSYIDIKWTDSPRTHQGALGLKVGFDW